MLQSERRHSFGVTYQLRIVEHHQRTNALGHASVGRTACG